MENEKIKGHTFTFVQNEDIALDCITELDGNQLHCKGFQLIVEAGEITRLVIELYLTKVRIG